MILSKTARLNFFARFALKRMLCKVQIYISIVINLAVYFTIIAKSPNFNSPPNFSALRYKHAHMDIYTVVVVALVEISTSVQRNLPI